MYIHISVSGKGQIITQGSSESAGYDIYSAEAITIPSGKRRLVSTGLKMAIPSGYYGRIASRSSLAYKNSVDVCAGVIDSDYRGEVKVLLANFGDSDFQVNIGDRIAQIIFEKCYSMNINLVNELPDTVRGEGGFGSTGK